jgi:hypothetical protein
VVPLGPNDEVTADFCQVKGKRYLVVVDVFSMFWEAFEVHSEGAQAVTKALSTFFARFGAPRRFRSDGGRGLVAEETKQFLARWNVEWVPPSSAEYPKSNGAAESAVKIFKRLLARAKTHEEFQLGLLMLRATPNRSKCSPSEAFLGRVPRTALHAPIPSVLSWDKIRENKQADKEKQKRVYDKGTRVLKPIPLNTRVQIKVGKKRQEGVVVGQRAQPRAFDVRLASGAVSARNRFQLHVLPDAKVSLSSLSSNRRRSFQVGRQLPLRHSDSLLRDSHYSRLSTRATPPVAPKPDQSTNVLDHSSLFHPRPASKKRAKVQQESRNVNEVGVQGDNIARTPGWIATPLQWWKKYLQMWTTMKTSWPHCSTARTTVDSASPVTAKATKGPLRGGGRKVEMTARNFP